MLRGCVVFVVLLLLPAVVLAHGVGGKDAAFLKQTAGTQTIPFLYLGAKHMVTGYDHLLFLVGVIFFLYRVALTLAHLTGPAKPAGIGARRSRRCASRRSASISAAVIARLSSRLIVLITKSLLTSPDRRHSLVLRMEVYMRLNSCCRGCLARVAAMLLALGLVSSSRLNAQGSTSASVLVPPQH